MNREQEYEKQRLRPHPNDIYHDVAEGGRRFLTDREAAEHYREKYAITPKASAPPDGHGGKLETDELTATIACLCGETFQATAEDRAAWPRTWWGVKYEFQQHCSRVRAGS